MSYIFKYLPEPGITYDIIRMLYVKLNVTNVWKETLTTIDGQKDHEHFIEKHAKQLPDPDSDLTIFFYIPTNRKRTFLSYIIEDEISESFTEFTIDVLLKRLNDSPTITDKLFTYYLGEDIRHKPDFEYQLRFIKTIPDKIKLILFGFYYNPEIFLHKLRQTIHEYYYIIDNTFPLVQINSEMLTLFTNLLPTSNLNVNKHKEGTNKIIWYSLCRCTPRLTMYGNSQNTFFFITTPNTIFDKINDKYEYSILELLETIRAIDDHYRLKIMQLLKSTPDLTTMEISDKLELSLTATKYHLSILKKANMITYKRNNRSAYYSYNPDGYKSLLKALENFEKGGFK